jgi:hypothetical protein
MNLEQKTNYGYIQYIFSGQMQNEINSQRSFEYSLRCVLLFLLYIMTVFNLANFIDTRRVGFISASFAYKS